MEHFCRSNQVKVILIGSRDLLGDTTLSCPACGAFKVDPKFGVFHPACTPTEDSLSVADVDTIWLRKFEIECGETTSKRVQLFVDCLKRDVIIKAGSQGLSITLDNPPRYDEVNTVDKASKWLLENVAKLRRMAGI